MIRIALVDDHSMFREGIKAIVNTFEDMEVALECGNGRELIAQLNSDIDIVLLDLDMPELSGIETMEQLRVSHPTLNVLILSQNKSPALICSLMELGARGFINKEDESNTLQKALFSVRDTGYFFNDLVSQAMLVKLASKENIKPVFNYVEQLTERETDVLKLICKEFTAQEIGEKLFISPNTVNNHRARILEKTGSRNTAGLVVFALKNQLVHV